MRALLSLFTVFAVPSAAFALTFDDTPRTAIMSAFPPEIVALQEGFTDQVSHS